MLSVLTVENVALIEKLEVELADRLNILSGETGAGKSIIIDSLNFVLGERADKGLIRYGAPFAVVEAVFSDYLTPRTSDALAELGIEAEDVLVLRRKLTAEGKNECRINGRVCTLSTLKQVTETLVDIHGQHEHQSLLKPVNHIILLDGLGGESLASAKAEYANAYRSYRDLIAEYDRYGDEEARLRRLDILKFQLDEIYAAAVYDGEEDELIDRRRRVRNTEKILDALAAASNALDGYERDSVAATLKSASASLNPITGFDEEISGLQERIDGAKSEVADIAECLKDISARLDYDARSADALEERLETVRKILRKYGGSYAALQDFVEKSEKEADMLENASERVKELDGLIEKAAAILAKSGAKLSALRADCAADFQNKITKELKDLGMGGTTFSVSMDSVSAPEDMREDGADRVEFMISPNVGEPLKPLAKIISGGEMSRFMLALKNIVADVDGIGTMVFDEIDTGISGKISAVVAEKLCNISRRRQVIAVTHMPSLAAMADAHFLIEKRVDDGKTHTYVRLLQDDSEEIARLIGGNEYSSHAFPHALEMKQWAARYKENAADRLKNA